MKISEKEWNKIFMRGFITGVLIASALWLAAVCTTA